MLPVSVIALQLVCLVDVSNSGENREINDLKWSKTRKMAPEKPVKVTIKVKVNSSAGVNTYNNIKRPNLILIVVDDVGK
jgi:hypothetical protein